MAVETKSMTTIVDRVRDGIPDREMYRYKGHYVRKMDNNKPQFGFEIVTYEGNSVFPKEIWFYAKEHAFGSIDLWIVVHQLDHVHAQLYGDECDARDRRYSMWHSLVSALRYFGGQNFASLPFEHPDGKPVEFPSKPLHDKVS